MRGTLMNGITARATVKSDDDDDKVTAADVGPGPVAEPAGGAPAAGPARPRFRLSADGPVVRYGGPLAVLAAVLGLWYFVSYGVLEPSRRFLLPAPHVVVTDGLFGPSVSGMLEALGLEPLLDVGMRLGEGSGAVAALPLLRSGIAVLRDVALLSEILPS